MSDPRNPQNAKANGVDVEHPRMRVFLERCAKDGVTKERAQKLSGMPYEVVDRYYQQAKSK
jgi:hypothetical protein